MVSWLFLLLMILAVSAVAAVAAVRRHGVVHLLTMTAAGCVAVFVLSVAVYRGARHVSSVTENATVSHDGDMSREVAGTPSLMSLSADLPDEATTTDEPVAASTASVRRTENGDMLVLSLSPDFVAGLLGPQGVDVVKKLNASISPELQHAYALIPLSAPVPQTAGPVIRHALSPVGIRSFLSALSHLWAAADAGSPLSAEAETVVDATADLSAAEPPEWISNPGIGQTVVQSPFVEASIPAEEALRPVIVDALKQRVTALAARKFAADDGWEKIVDLSVTDDAIRHSWRKTFARTEVIDTVGNPTPMRQTFALIEFPEEFEKQILADVETALKRNRVTALCLTLGIVWLCVVMLNLAVRAGQHGSFLRKLATLPAMGLLILPCIIAFFIMTSAMAHGRTFDFSWSENRISCVLDAVRE